MPKSNFLRINDLVNFTLTNSELVKIQDDFRQGLLNPQVSTNTNKGLNVKIAATHAGIVTRNNGFYLPDKMKRGATSFVDNYPKPILLHHDSDKDPIGRVVASTYVDTSGSIKDRYKGSAVKDKSGKQIATISDQFIDDFSTGKMPFGMQVDVVRTFFKDSVLEDSSYAGLGFIQITANITDQAAIEKLLDGRYLTGSVGATTDKAVCSICKQDWTDTGACDHKPGAIYDKAKCFIIAGELMYDEYSFVNRPADRHSKTLELNYNGIQNSVEIANDLNSRIYEVTLEFPQYENHNKEDKLMPLKEEIKDSVQEDLKVAETPETPTTEQVIEESFDDFFSRILSVTDNLNDQDESKLYDMFLAEMKSAGLTDQEVEDAKLSVEKRKNLASSTFCGPGKSFPVPDCAHVVAARRLIGRYKGPGDKTSILSCVSRKAKAMGCSTEDSVKDNMQHARILHMLISTLEENHYAPMDGDTALSEQDVAAITSVMKKLVNLVGQDNFMKTVSNKELGLNLKSYQDKALLEEVTKLEELVGTLRDEVKESADTVSATREEYKALHKDMTVMQDSLITDKLKSRKNKEKFATLLLDLKEQNMSPDREVEVQKLTDEVLDFEIDKTIKEVDIKKITDKLSDGMSRKPVGSVDNPSQLQDDTQKREIVQQNDNAFIQQWLYLDKLYGRKVADDFKAQFLKSKV